jgi:hypothetical protein
MKIKNKKTGKIVEVPEHLIEDVKLVIQQGGDPMAVLEAEGIPTAKYGKKLLKAQNGFYNEDESVPLNKGNMFTGVLNNPYEDRANYFGTGQHIKDASKPSVVPFETRDYNTGIVSTGVYNASSVNQFNSNNPNLSGNNLPDYASQINNPNFGGEGNQQEQQDPTNIFKTALKAGVLTENTFRNAQTTHGNIKAGFENQAFDNTQLYNALKPRFNNQFTEDRYGSNQGLQLMEMGGISDYKAEYGANVEVEGGEMISLPNGLAETIYGDSHSQGGINMNLPPESKVFSKKLKIKNDKGKKKSFATLAKPFETKKDIENLESSISDNINKKTAELNIALKENSRDEIFNLQEGLKISGFFNKKIQQETIDNYKKQYGGSINNGYEEIHVAELGGYFRKKI